MRNSFAKFPELLLCDSTYNTEELRTPFFVLMVVDGNNQAHVVAVYLALIENDPGVKEMLRVFKEYNADWSRVETILSGNDLIEKNAFSDMFPQASFQLCTYHVMNIFRKKIPGKILKCNPKDGQEIILILQSMLYAKSEYQYMSLYEQLKKLQNSDLEKYFNENWHCIREQWVRQLKKSVNYDTHTSNLVESFNKDIKNIIKDMTSIDGLFLGLKKAIRSWEDQIEHKNSYSALKVDAHSRNTGDFQEDERKYKKIMTDHGFNLFIRELKAANKAILAGIFQENDSLFTLPAMNGFDSQQFSEINCSCSFYMQIRLPCRHMLSLWKYFNKCIFDEQQIPARWLKSYNCQMDNIISGSPMQAAQTEVIHDTKDDIGVCSGLQNVTGNKVVYKKILPKTDITIFNSGNNIKCLSENEAEQASLHRFERYREAEHLCMEAATILSIFSGISFQRKMATLREVISFWKEEKDVSITVSITSSIIILFI